MPKTKSNPASTKEAGLLQVSETLRSCLILLLSCCIEAELLQHGFMQECCGLPGSDQIVRHQRVLDLDENRAVVDALLAAVQTLDVRIDAGILAVNAANGLFREFYALLDPRSAQGCPGTSSRSYRSCPQRGASAQPAARPAAAAPHHPSRARGRTADFRSSRGGIPTVRFSSFFSGTDCPDSP